MGHSKPAPATLPSHIKLDHVVFSRFAECLFYLSAPSEEFVLSVNIGGNQVVLPVAGIIKEFVLGPADVEMLELVGQSLRFVRGLRIGDALPKEVLTGEASWEVSQKHQMLARQRVLMQLVNWLMGVETLLTSPEQLMQLANDPTTKKKVNEAFGEAAERLGLGRENREQMLPYVEKLSNELSYVEALREIVESIRAMLGKVEGLRKIYQREKTLLQTLDQVRKLMLVAVAEFDERIIELDAQTGEIIAVLQNLERQVLFIREKRDDLYVRLLAWREVIDEWRRVDVAMSLKMENVIARLYQFLAARYMKTDEWVLMTQLQLRAENIDDLKKKKKVLVW
ncbi:hypothetical protein [Telmatospirillum siberiense]|uniref:Uncharacterized protein n=1 Tax=Telmatospirillum siberiense TaxID=382514 RepID=A0A2N3PXJ7_9PROT|nr:hypothetical protein [Telmatospirillum siberiense]PKU25134.1 hypothetical protein CWS72_08015 [Telmatospirillum siberiense]